MFLDFFVASFTFFLKIEFKGKSVFENPSNVFFLTKIYQYIGVFLTSFFIKKGEAKKSYVCVYNIFSTTLI